MVEEPLRVRKIREGTVIDHIPAGLALTVIQILGITGREGNVIAMVMNVDSKKLGKKDILKIEGKELRPEEVNKVALVAPTATINIVKDFTVIKKFKVDIPSEIKGIISCPNPTCITRTEKIEPVFKVISKSPLKLQCDYCGTYINKKEVIKQLIK